jgi:RHS repeat-associated protein
VVGRYYRYYAYGETKNEQVSMNQAYKYTGKPLDTEKGLNLYYFGARYYNPAIGRWLAVDPQASKSP